MAMPIPMPMPFDVGDAARRYAPPTAAAASEAPRPQSITDGVLEANRPLPAEPPMLFAYRVPLAPSMRMPRLDPSDCAGISDWRIGQSLG